MKTTCSSSTQLALLAAPMLLLLAGLAVAHPGHDHVHGGGFAAGLAHPLLGLDHLLAMLAVGLWSLRQSRAFSLAAPALAAGGMLLGAGWPGPAWYCRAWSSASPCRYCWQGC